MLSRSTATQKQSCLRGLWNDIFNSRGTWGRLGLGRHRRREGLENLPNHVAVSIVQIFQKETALMMRAAISAIVFCGTQIYGQTPLPTFEAASVKPNKSITESSSWHSRTGYLVMRNQTLNDLIRIAYQLKADQVTGGPKWLVSDRFDIEARASGPARDPELLVMLQTLLAERFQLKLHRDTKLVSGYALIV